MTDIEEKFYMIIHCLEAQLGSFEKALLWLNVSNPNLGGARPMDLITRDRIHKLMRFIEVAIEENQSSRLD